MLRSTTTLQPGARLWFDHEDAQRFARARFVLYGTRQRVVPVRAAAGELLWHVKPAVPGRREVSEPCS